VISIRRRLENREQEYLSPYASFSSKSKGRHRGEEECDIRTAFQRDRDRILHSKAFRRLKQKTQVFLLPKGDHYRTRLTHTLEVSQNARTIGKALHLNEDLVEAIALGHDIGHTPFGHAGENALDMVYRFSHSRQGLRVVEHLERQGLGLNLTWEVRDGILNHQTSKTPHTLEGQVVRLSDKIAYINHDIDDAIRGGIMTEEDIPKSIRAVLGETNANRLDTMVNDIIIQSIEKPEVKMSTEIGEAMAELRGFLFQSVYLNPKAKSTEEKAIHLIKELYNYYISNTCSLPQQFLEQLDYRENNLEQIVCDYIAGMTDSYAVQRYQEIFVPEAWKT